VSLIFNPEDTSLPYKYITSISAHKLVMESIRYFFKSRFSISLIGGIAIFDSNDYKTIQPKKSKPLTGILSLQHSVVERALDRKLELLQYYNQGREEVIM